MELGGEKMLKKLYRTLGFALISCNLFFTPVMAYADSSVSVGTNMCFAIPGGLITGFVLVSMSRTKQKATKADKYRVILNSMGVTTPICVPPLIRLR